MVPWSRLLNFGTEYTYSDADLHTSLHKKEKKPKPFICIQSKCLAFWVYLQKCSPCQPLKNSFLLPWGQAQWLKPVSLATGMVVLQFVETPELYLPPKALQQTVWWEASSQMPEQPSLSIIQNVSHKSEDSHSDIDLTLKQSESMNNCYSTFSTCGWMVIATATMQI